MEHEKLIPVNKKIAESAWIKKEEYEKLYKQSVEKPDEFWGDQAKKFLTWSKPFTKVKKASFAKEDFGISWFEDGELNACYNAVDRHLPHAANKTAYIWEGDAPGEVKKITYQQLFDNVNKYALILKQLGIKKGDTVIIYMPLILDAIYAMLACARVGAVHSIVFGGFSSKSLNERIIDTKAKLVITADAGKRGGKLIKLKDNVDQAIQGADELKNVLVIKHTNTEITKGHKDVFVEDVKVDTTQICPPEPMKAEDPLFILYTSGSTNKPKGIMHTTGGYLLYASMTHKYIFDYKDGEVYWCTADIGWVTGHSYVVYGPLINQATVFVYEGVPNYPDFSRMWDMVERHKINILYTAPTLIRSLMKESDDFVTKHNRSSLRILGSVGEPINPEAWLWFYHIVGDSKCPIMDTWWQTETGGFLITPFPGVTDLKPGSATRPFFGVVPVIVDNNGKEITTTEAEGNLCIKHSWPGQARTIWGNHERFYNTYFSTYPNLYFSGDGCKRDAEGYYWITGRVDDVINVSGHRIGTAEIESALVGHSGVAEAAVVGYPHEIKGQGMYVFVILKSGFTASDEVKKELISWVKTQVGSVATPDVIHFTRDLPKTRSGKIMRRILRKICEGEFENIGDTSTLADPSIVQELIDGYKKMIGK